MFMKGHDEFEVALRMIMLVVIPATWNAASLEVSPHHIRKSECHHYGESSQQPSTRGLEASHEHLESSFLILRQP